MNNLFLKILVILIFVLICFLINLAKSAVITVNDTAVAKKAESGDKKAKKLLKLIEKPTLYNLAVSNITVLLLLLSSAFLSLSFTKWFAEAFTYKFGLVQYNKIVLILAILLFTFLLAYLLVVLGKTVPEKIGAVNCDKISYSMCGFLKFVIAIIKPFTLLANGTSNIVLRLFGIDPRSGEEQVTEEEIMMMVDAGKEKGVIEQTQRSMINNIFEFDDLIVSEIMTHRTEIEAVEVTQDIQDIVNLAIEKGYSRIPVYEEDLDNIKGIVYIKDLLKFVGKNVPKGTISDIMRNAYYVPETKKCNELFSQMREKRLQMCVVADEYGGTAGIVTVEDLLESIVGNMQDEYDNEDEEVIKINETTFTLDGTMLVSDAEEILQCELPEGEYDTVGGMIISRLGAIPSENEQPEIQIDNLMFKVLSVAERRIDKVRVEKLKPESEQEEE
ncbi:MAG: hemolysin family protein [Acutalibacteraceae bacterium]|nr:hemolysin family protein [Acutalibacteraceae bacterium]